jgi:hypothetical protein
MSDHMKLISSLAGKGRHLSGEDVQKIKDLLDPFDCYENLQCDGFSNIAHHFLSKANIPHTQMVGSVKFQDLTMDLHRWIVVGNYTLDYRLRMWFGPCAPHGVFINHSVLYSGKEVFIELPDLIINALLCPF